jgi:ubiquinone/menaquinone biosynthesis C-methylase UbiE
MRDFTNINKYLDILNRDVYPEAEMRQHEEITERIFNNFIKPNRHRFNLVLDVGCGQGIALNRFKSLNINAIGITIGKEDYDVCLKKGFEVKIMDQSFLDFHDNQFDFVYARHVLEHSPFPLLTLFEFNRVLKNNGHLYVEVPWAESIHTTNPNHYSMLGRMSWVHLFKKSNFDVLKEIKMNFNLIGGEPDEYWGWWLGKSMDLNAFEIN